MAQKKYHSVVFVIVVPVLAPPNRNIWPCGIIRMPAAARGEFIVGPTVKVLVATSNTYVDASGTGARMLPSPPPARRNLPLPIGHPFWLTRAVAIEPTAVQVLATAS